MINEFYNNNHLQHFLTKKRISIDFVTHNNVSWGWFNKSVGF